MSRHFSLAALLLATLCHNMTSAQVSNPRTNINNAAATVKPKAPAASDSLIEAKLIELALQGPMYRASGHQNKINELELKKTKNAWLNLLAVSYAVNDQTFNNKPTASGTTVVFPKYNFTLTVPFGVIFSQSVQTKSAREGLKYSTDMQEQLARSIKADILSKYKQYKSYIPLIEMQNELINDVLATTSQAEEDFKKGTISVEDYIKGQRARNEEVAKKMGLELQQDLVKLEIEKIIGVPLEQALEMAKQPAPTR
ncbi:MAG: TolC family protein [Chitinophagaceae bacterium]